MRRSRIELKTAHALITGGARGIGFDTARRLLHEGSRITLWDLDRHALERAEERLREETPEAVVALRQCDIGDYLQMREALTVAERVTGPVDILINNAGHMAPGDFLDQDSEVWQQTIKINLSALVELTHLVLPGMYERRRGHIINISSAAGTIGVPGLAVYSASKWGVWGFSEALRAEAATRGVMVSSIHPSYIATGMFSGARVTGIGSLLVPQLRSHDVVAEAIVESALKRGRTSPKRPRTVRLAILLRGILPDSLFNAAMKRLGVWNSMRSWRGPQR